MSYKSVKLVQERSSSKFVDMISEAKMPRKMFLNDLENQIRLKILDNTAYRARSGFLSALCLNKKTLGLTRDIEKSYREARIFSKKIFACLIERSR